MNLPKRICVVMAGSVLVLFLGATAAVAQATPAPITLDSLAAPAGVEPTEETCGGCTVKYWFNKDKCKLFRKAECDVKHCVRVPGMSTDACKTTHTSNTTQVTATKATGSAEVQLCNGNRCTGATTQCADFDYLKPTLKPAEADKAATSELLMNEDGSESVTAEVVWDGGALLTYTLTNTSSATVSVSWFGTAFTDTFLAPGDSISETSFTEGPPAASLRDLVITDFDSQSTVVLEAATYLTAAADEAPVEF